MSTAFSAPGRSWRGNLHCHSSRSDGALEPGEVCRRYREAGYGFIALTDHYVGIYGYPLTDTRGHRAPGVTTLTGAELHTGRMANGELWHLLAVGLPEGFAPPEALHFLPVEGSESAAALAARARAAGAFVALVHPQWNALGLADAMSVEAAHAIEIYNHTCALDCDRGDGAHLADRMLAAGRRLNLIATDDAHFAIDDAFGGWVMVKAEANEPAALLAALKAGHFYASQGPELHEVWSAPL